MVRDHPVPAVLGLRFPGGGRNRACPRDWVERPLRFNFFRHRADEGMTAALVRRKGTKGMTVARIIAIEDSPALQRLLAITMRDSGLEIEAHLTGATGLAAALDDPPDLVILDLGLPDMPGWEILERLRTEPATVNLPVVVATGETRSVVIERLSDLGAVMLEKPYTGAVLRATVEMLLAAQMEVGSSA